MKRYSNPNRSLRIAQQIMEDVMHILRFEVKNPRLQQLITINDVQLNVDNSVAKIYWVASNCEDLGQLQKALKASKGFIRSRLAQRFHTYTVADLEFVYDDSLQRGGGILSILDKIQHENKNN